MFDPTKPIATEDLDGDFLDGWWKIARYIGVSTREAQRLANFGPRGLLLPVVQLGGRCRMYTASYERWRERCEPSVRPLVKWRAKNRVVYAITYESSDRIKIGFTGDLDKRMDAISSHCGYPIHLLAVIKGGQDVEVGLHESLARWRVHREWFTDVIQVRQALVNAVEFHGGELWFARPT